MRYGQLPTRQTAICYMCSFVDPESETAPAPGSPLSSIFWPTSLSSQTPPPPPPPHLQINPPLTDYLLTISTIPILSRPWPKMPLSSIFPGPEKSPPVFQNIARFVKTMGPVYYINQQSGRVNCVVYCISKVEGRVTCVLY